MKLMIYGVSDDELKFFKQIAKQDNHEFSYCQESLTLDNACLAKGFKCISTISTPLDKNILDKLKEVGVEFISTRTVGYEHIDMEYAKKIQMHVGNATYGSESVCDYTIMMILMMLRKMKVVMRSYELQDYSFKRVLGQNLTNKTIGIVGSGAIGSMLVKRLSAFGCKILIYSKHQKEELTNYGTYVSWDELLKQSDIISLHLRLCDDTYHIINQDSIALMKDGVMLVNSARGGLIDNDALINALENGKISACCLDVVEGEAGIYYDNHKGEIITTRQMKLLQGFPNVLMLPHLAFLTDDAISDMVSHSIESCHAYLNNEENKWQLC